MASTGTPVPRDSCDHERFWLTATPALPDAHQAAAQAKGRERYERFVEALGRRLSKGPTLLREVSIDLPATADPTRVAPDESVRPDGE